MQLLSLFVTTLALLDELLDEDDELLDELEPELLPLLLPPPFITIIPPEPPLEPAFEETGTH